MTTFKNKPIWTTIVTILSLISLPITSIIILLTTPFLGGRQAFRKIVSSWINAIFWSCNIKLNIIGWDQLPGTIKNGQESVVFISNHESNFDPLILISVIPIPTVCLSKKELKLAIPMGWVAMAAGTIFIDRSNSERAMKSLRTAIMEVRNGKSVIIFPEGTRTRTGELLPFKKGGFIIAKEAGVRIVPVATKGGFQIWPAGTACLRHYSNYIVNFGQPVDPKLFKSKYDLIAEVRKRVQDLQSI